MLGFVFCFKAACVFIHITSTVTEFRVNFTKCVKNVIYYGN